MHRKQQNIRGSSWLINGFLLVPNVTQYTRGAQFEYLLQKKKKKKKVQNFQHVLFIIIFKPHKVISQTKAATESEMYFHSFLDPFRICKYCIPSVRGKKMFSLLYIGNK
jgi:hypothetical protein